MYRDKYPHIHPPTTYILLPLLDLGPVVVPRLEHFLGLLGGDAPVLGEPEGRLAVGDGEVEGLGLWSLRFSWWVMRVVARASVVSA